MPTPEPNNSISNFDMFQRMVLAIVAAQGGNVAAVTAIAVGYKIPAAQFDSVTDTTELAAMASQLVSWRLGQSPMPYFVAHSPGF